VHTHGWKETWSTECAGWCWGKEKGDIPNELMVNDAMLESMTGMGIGATRVDQARGYDFVMTTVMTMFSLSLLYFDFGTLAVGEYMEDILNLE
jgi:hypothetical protein